MIRRRLSRCEGSVRVVYRQVDRTAVSSRIEIDLRREATPTDIEASFQRAIEVARSQKAKLFELRASASLARLWHSWGKTGEACGLLAPVCSWFSEGLDTIDLREAKALLNELSQADHQQKSAIANVKT